MFKVNNKTTKTKTPEWRQRRHSGVFIVNFKKISHLFLMFLLTLNKYLLAGLTLHIGFNTCYNLWVFRNIHVAYFVFRFIQSKFPDQDKNSWFTIASLFSRTYFLKYPEKRQWKTLSHFFHSNCISICFSFLFKFLTMLGSVKCKSTYWKKI